MEFFATLVDLLESTKVPDQIRQVNVADLFTNPWFLAPFVLFISYNLYRQSVNTLVITALVVGLWIFSGSTMMEGLIVDGHLQLDKLLPVAGVYLAAVAIAIYFLFMRE